MPAPDLIPQVTGPLAAQEATIIALLQAGAEGGKCRSTISLDPALALATVRAADAEKRDFSNFIAVILHDYHGRNSRLSPAPDLAEFIAKLSAAYAASPRVLAKMQALIVKEMRAAKPEPAKRRDAA